MYTYTGEALPDVRPRCHVGCIILLLKWNIEVVKASYRFVSMLFIYPVLSNTEACLHCITSFMPLETWFLISVHDARLFCCLGLGFQSGPPQAFLYNVSVWESEDRGQF